MNTLSKLPIGLQGTFMSVGLSGIPSWGTTIYGAGTSDSLPSLILTNQAKNKVASTFGQRTDTSVIGFSFTPNTGKPLLTVKGAAGNQIVHLDSAGYFSLGPTLATQKLWLSGATSEDVQMVLEQPASNRSALMSFNSDGAVSTSNPDWSMGIVYNTNDFAFSTWDGSNTIQRMVVEANTGDIGIGESNPTTDLQITSTDASTSVTIKINAAQANADGTLIDFRSTTGSEGSITLAAGGIVAYNTFTGAHYAQLQNEAESLEVGMLVSATGQLMESTRQLPLITKTRERGDNRVYGVFAGKIADGAAIGEVDSFRTWREKKERMKRASERSAKVADSLTLHPSPDGRGKNISRDETGNWDKRKKGKSYDFGKGDGHKDMYQIFAVGTGIVMVTETGGNIAVGDLIWSSPIGGLGEKQPDDFVRSATVAKAMESVDWSKVFPSRNGLKRKVIACTFK